jgi:hypothetical protein
MAGTTGAGMKGGGGGGGGGPMLVRCSATIDFPSTNFSRTIARSMRPFETRGKGFLLRSSFRRATQASAARSVRAFRAFRMVFGNRKIKLFERTLEAIRSKWLWNLRKIRRTEFALFFQNLQNNHLPLMHLTISPRIQNPMKSTMLDLIKTREILIPRIMI